MFTFVVRRDFLIYFCHPFPIESIPEIALCYWSHLWEKNVFSDFPSLQSTKYISARTPRLIEAGTISHSWAVLDIPHYATGAAFCAEIGEHEVKEAKKWWPKGRLSRLSVFSLRWRKNLRVESIDGRIDCTHEKMWNEMRKVDEWRFFTSQWKRAERKWKFLYFCARQRRSITKAPYMHVFLLTLREVMNNFEAHEGYIFFSLCPRKRTSRGPATAHKALAGRGRVWNWIFLRSHFSGLLQWINAFSWRTKALHSVLWYD